MHFGSRFVQLRQAALSCSVLVIGSQYRVNSVMSSLRLYCDGLVDKGKWCVGLTWIEFVTCNSNVTSRGENDIHGYCGDSTYIFQSVLSYHEATMSYTQRLDVLTLIVNLSLPRWINKAGELVFIS